MNKNGLTFHRNVLCNHHFNASTMRSYGTPHKTRFFFYLQCVPPEHDNVLYIYSSYPGDMANTYTQLHVQFVFAVKYRAALIQKVWKDQLHKYITGIFQENEHKMLQINSMPDHIHILIGMRPAQSVSSLVLPKGYSAGHVEAVAEGVSKNCKTLVP